MAAEVAFEQFIPETPELYVVPSFEEPSVEGYVLADAVPAIAAARLAIRQESETLLESRRQQYSHLSVAERPVPVNVLSTAHRVNEAKRQYGEESDEYLQLRSGLVLDNVRLAAEWFRKLKPEEFAPLRHKHDEEADDFLTHGLYTGKMTEDGILPMVNNAEGEARRINEHVEEKTAQIVRTLGGVALQGRSIRTISECPDKAIMDYQHDMRIKSPHRGYEGYVPEIQKLMIRDMWFDEETGDRYQKQVALPGTWLTPDVIRIALDERGLETANMTKTELQGSQLIVTDRLMDFVKYLDEVASEQWNREIFMGEEVPKGFSKDYEAFHTESIKRQEGLHDLAEEITTFELFLDEDGADPREAAILVEDFVKLQLLEMGKKDLKIAEQMFSAKTVAGLAKVVDLERTGQYEAAMMLMNEVGKQAEGGGSCGAGLCEGLESVKLVGKELDDLKKKIGAREGDTLTKDTLRNCQKCGQKGELFYSHKSTGSVKKYCGKCGGKS